MPILDGVTNLFRRRNVTPDAGAPQAGQPAANRDPVRNNSTVNQPTVDATSRVKTDGPRAKEAAAVKELRRLIESRELPKYYDAAIGRTQNPELADKAMKLFASLPKVNAAATADELVALGLWTVAPRGIPEMQKSPRYLPGRRILCPASLNPDLFNDKAFLTYLAPENGGKPGVTSRAVLVGEKGDKFLVKIDGKDEPIAVSKREIYKYNHPNDFTAGSPDRLQVSGGGYVFGRADYNEPLTKAKVCEAAIALDGIVGKIDFKAALEGDVMGKSPAAKQTVELQRKALGLVMGVIDMNYYHREYADSYAKDHRPHAAKVSAGRAAIRGTGKCHDHAAVNLALLTPFAASLGLDVKMYYGHTYTAMVRGDNPFEHKAKADGSSSGHSWMHIDFRPALNDPRVCDKTWRQPDTEADYAYTTRAGRRYPARTWFVPKTQKLTKTDIDCTGRVTCDTPVVLFGKEGRDGRQNHISNDLADWARRLRG